MFVCPLKALEWELELPPNFQGSSRASSGWFGHKRIGGCGYGAREFTFFGREGGEG